MEIIDAAVGGTMGNITNIDNGLAYVAVKVGNNWQLPSGKTAYPGDFIVVNGVFGHATATITGGSTNIVENTNWVAETNGGLNALVSRNKSPYYGSLKQISNTLLISTPLDASANDVGIVTSTSQYAPTDLIIGIREVFYFSSTKIAIVIHGVDTKNIYREWYRYYNGSVWTDWFRDELQNDRLALSARVSKLEFNHTDLNGETYTEFQFNLNSSDSLGYSQYLLRFNQRTKSIYVYGRNASNQYVLIYTINSEPLYVIENNYTLVAGQNYIAIPMISNHVLISAYTTGWDADALIAVGISVISPTQYAVFFNKTLPSNKTVGLRTTWINGYPLR